MALKIGRRTLVTGGLAALLLGGGIFAGSALAGPGRPGNPADRAEHQQRAEDFLSKLASNLKVDESTLRSALVKTRQEMIDDAVKAGRLTQQQADEIKQRIQQGNGLGFHMHAGARDGGQGFRRGAEGFRAFHETVISTAADVLGLTTDQVESALKSGKSLATLAQEQKKDLSTLKSKLVAALNAQVDKNASNGTITSEQATAIKQRTSEHVDKLVNGFDKFGPGGRNGPNDQNGPGGPNRPFRPGGPGRTGTPGTPTSTPTATPTR
jgi:uncharacterized protein YidB (DUF937 family)